MTQRRKWTAIPGLLVLAIGAVMLSAYSGASSSQGNGPDQPIKFPHPRHAGPVAKGGLGMNCLYCHNNANKSADVGMPAVNTCMGCHASVVGTTDAQKAEIKKIAQYADYAAGGKNGKPIPWVRIHKVPEYVHFPHVRHVNAGVTCQTCHGQVQGMEKVYQYSSLNMGWCVNCHVKGYDPAVGDAASGYTRTATGWQLASNDRPSLPQLPGGGLLVADARAQAAPVTPAATRKTARYDCSSCHY